MAAVRNRGEGWKLTQLEAATRLKVTQPRLNDLLRGHFNKFSLDGLVELAARAGIKVKVSWSAAPGRRLSASPGGRQHKRQVA
jgi:predicted XRE-type DNA-binding protein